MVLTGCILSPPRWLVEDEEILPFLWAEPRPRCQLASETL